MVRIMFRTRLILGKHYSRSCEDWLKLLLKNQKEAKEDLKDTYGDKAEVWFNRWIVFYLVWSISSVKANIRVCLNSLLIITEMNGSWHTISSPRNKSKGISLQEIKQLYQNIFYHILQNLLPSPQIRSSIKAVHSVAISQEAFDHSSHP
jgi:hypothetical protein